MYHSVEKYHQRNLAGGLEISFQVGRFRLMHVVDPHTLFATSISCRFSGSDTVAIKL